MKITIQQEKTLHSFTLVSTHMIYRLGCHTYLATAPLNEKFITVGEAANLDFILVIHPTFITYFEKIDLIHYSYVSCRGKHQLFYSALMLIKNYFCKFRNVLNQTCLYFKYIKCMFFYFSYFKKYV